MATEQGAFFEPVTEPEPIEDVGRLESVPSPKETESPTFIGHQIMCPCMNEITIKDLLRGYHNRCDRKIEIVTWRFT